MWAHGWSNMAATEDAEPNKSARKPNKALDTMPPKELAIDGIKSSEVVKSQLKLKNTSKNKIAYKVSVGFANRANCLGQNIRGLRVD